MSRLVKEERVLFQGFSPRFLRVYGNYNTLWCLVMDPDHCRIVQEICAVFVRIVLFTIKA